MKAFAGPIPKIVRTLGSRVKNKLVRSMDKARASLSPKPESARFEIDATLVHLAEVVPSPVVEEVKRLFMADFGERKAMKNFTPNDWNRITWILGAVPEGSVLDVGTGQGQFSAALSLSRRHPRHATIDIRPYQFFRMHGEYERYDMSVASMRFRDGEFDTVVCMEVIEHLTDQLFEPALRELRRVAKRKLVLTVPYCEPLPLSKHHRQRFDADRVLDLFPNGKFTLLLKAPVTRVPWLLVEEETKIAP